MLRVDREVFARIRTLVYDNSGIVLGPGKEHLVGARLANRMRTLGITKPDEYLLHLEGDRTGNELVFLLDAISTNYTKFFREPSHFEALVEWAQRQLALGLRRIRLWCAASSTGEEPYTLAMTVLEALAGAQVDFKLLATDISTDVLMTAKRGIYADKSIQQIPPRLVLRYFRRQESSPRLEPTWRVNAALRQLVIFRRLNLAQPPFPMKGPLDVVFCRNVMIYFDERVRERLVREIERLLRPGGLLFVGHSESLTGISSRLVRCGSAIYRKPE